MQKGRLLLYLRRRQAMLYFRRKQAMLYFRRKQAMLTIFSFPVVATLLILLIFQAYIEDRGSEEKVLGEAYANIQTFQPTTPPEIIPASPTEKITPTKKPTPSLTPTSATKQKTIATPVPQQSPTDYILAEVNKYRESQGLAKVSVNTETCSLAKVRAQEIASRENFNHNGFTERVNSKTLPYSSYSEISENIAYNTDFSDVVNRWIASPGHAENMRKNTQFVCIGKYGDYYTYEGWQP